MTGSRPPLSISLDLDNLWSYMKTHGDPGWEALPSYLDTLVAILLPKLRDHGLRLTVFVVGQDAALARNRAALRAISDGGHEIGNHSFHHEPWLHLYSREEISRELERAEQAIGEATGQSPRGFRGPGFSLSRDTVEVLAERGYAYDGSTLPTFLGPIARAYYFWSARNMDRAERAKRAKLFGTFRDGFRPLSPYLLEARKGRLLEIPVTTFPVAKSPMHLSYVLYLAGFSMFLGLWYLRLGLRLCRLLRVQPSYLLHPLDFLGGDRVEDLAFFPGMRLDTSYKLDVFDRAVRHLKRLFDPIPMGEHADHLLGSAGIPVRALRGG